MRSICFALVTGIAWLSSSLGANAAPVTWEFEAVVHGSSGFPFFDGQILSGSLSFESSTPDSDPGNLAGRYLGAITGVQIEYQIGLGEPNEQGPWDLALSATPGASQIFAINSSLLDRLHLQSELSGGSYLEPPIAFVELILKSSVSGFLTGDDLPLVPPALSILDPFDPVLLSTGLFLGSAQGNYSVEAELTALHAVPEPSGTELAFGALLALTLARALRASSVPD